MSPHPPKLFDDVAIPDVNALRSAFETCRYRVFLRRQVITLCVGRLAAQLERHIPRCRTFSLITAWNPWASAASPRHNRSADRGLQRWLYLRGAPHWPAVNGVGTWQESSWLVGNPPLGQLDVVARQLGQIATLHWRRGDPVALRWHVDPAGHRQRFVDAGRADP